MRVAVGGFEVSRGHLAALSRKLGRKATRLDARVLIARAALDALDDLLADDVPAALEASLRCAPSAALRKETGR